MPEPKKPWRTVMEAPERAGRFTREQVQEAVRAVKAESEARARKKKRAARPATFAPDGIEPQSEAR